MNVGKKYHLLEFLTWSRRDIYYCLLLSVIPTVLYCMGMQFIAFSWMPFSTIIGWAFITLDAVGDSAINPFEGSANDVPITQISIMIETDMR